MSCDKSGSINISTTTETCSGQCKLLYNYEIGNVSITNNPDHIIINPQGNLGDKPVNYSSSGSDSAQIAGDFTVQEIGLYKPSLHKYEGVNTDAELVIYHKHITGGQDLLISIPITSSTSYVTNQPKASSQLSEIIDNVGLLKDGLMHGMDFDLNQFIPDQPYYIYYAPSPRDDMKCRNVTNIAFDERFSMYISEERLNKLPIYSTTENKATENIKDLVETFMNKISPKIEGFGGLDYKYNKDGPVRGTTAKDDNIYIDCQPVGSSGKLLSEESKQKDVTGSIFNMYITDTRKYVLGFFISVIILFLSFKMVRFIISKLKGNGALAPRAVRNAALRFEYE